MVLVTTRSQTERHRLHEVNQLSLYIDLTSGLISRLETIFQNYNERFEANGNDYLYPILEARRARHDIGNGNLVDTLLVLIKSHLNYEEEFLLSNPNQHIQNLPPRRWRLEFCLGREIINKFRNTEDIEDIINDDSRLRTEIYYAAQSYGDALGIAV